MIQFGPGDKTGSLEVVLSNLDSDDGMVLVGIYNEELQWLNHQYAGEKALINDGKAVVTFTNLPYGSYAISCFHDVNNNDKFDTNFLGLPKEPYAFSNNAKSLFGPPGWKKAVFTITADQKTIHMIEHPTKIHLIG